MAQDIDAALSSLYELQNSYEFSIIKLSEQLTIESDPNPSNRTSDVSNDSIQTSITPASLEADLAHYKVCEADYRSVERLCPLFDWIVMTDILFNRISSPSYDFPTSSKSPKRSFYARSLVIHLWSSNTNRMSLWKANWWAVRRPWRRRRPMSQTWSWSSSLKAGHWAEVRRMLFNECLHLVLCFDWYLDW